MLKIRQGSKFDRLDVEGVYVETLSHGINKVLVADEDKIPNLLESHHVVFDELKLPGAPSRVDSMNNEAESGNNVHPVEFEISRKSDTDGSLDIPFHEISFGQFFDA